MMLRSAGKFWSGVSRECALQRRRRRNRQLSTRSSLGWSITRSFTCPRRTAWSNTRARHGARATFARGRWSFCSRSNMTRRCGKSSSSFSGGNLPPAPSRNGSCCEPYGMIQDPHSHGDIPIWPLKALCDYIECTDDFTAFLSEPVPWRDGTRARAASPRIANALLAQLAGAVHPRHAPCPASARATGTTRCSPPIRL